jgi:hypothetical protein
LLTADGQTVDLQQPAANYVQYCVNGQGPMLFLFDGSAAVQQLSSQLLKRYLHWLQSDISEGCCCTAVAVLVFYITERLKSIQLLKNAIYAARLKLPRAMKSLREYYKYFTTQWHFYSESLMIDQLELRKHPSTEVQHHCWELPAQYLAQFQAVGVTEVESRNEMLDSRLFPAHQKSLEVNQTFTRLVTEESCAQSMYQLRLQVRKGLTVTHVPTASDVKNCLARFLAADQQIHSQAAECLQHVEMNRLETASCLQSVAVLHQQLDTAVKLVSQCQQQRQKHIWQLLTHSTLQLKTMSSSEENPDLNVASSKNALARESLYSRECSEMNAACECSRLDSNDLVAQALHTKARLNELLHSLVLEYAVKNAATDLDWSFLDFNVTCQPNKTSQT